MIVLRGFLSKKIMWALHAGVAGNAVPMAQSMGEEIGVLRQCLRRMRALGAIDVVATNTFNLSDAGRKWCQAQEAKAQSVASKGAANPRLQPNSIFELAEKPIKRMKKFSR